jgi:hypothetical protein
MNYKSKILFPSSQSTHNVLIVEKFDTKNVGKYICKAENSLGAVSKEVSISIRLAPTVKVVPEKVTIKDGETGSLECVVEGNHGDYKIQWKDDYDILSVKVKHSGESLRSTNTEPFNP